MRQFVQRLGLKSKMQIHLCISIGNEGKRSDWKAIFVPIVVFVLIALNYFLEASA